jgi:hypothetical protein
VKEEVEAMAAELQNRRDETPALKVIDGGLAEPQREGAEVVAEVLSDGTIRVLGVPQAGEDEGFSVGHLTGPGWTIWWDRRRW